MPEIYDPRRSRGNAGKSGLRRMPREPKPYWPGLDMEGNLIKKNKPSTEQEAFAKVPDPMEDDSILSFDNDPPIRRGEVAEDDATSNTSFVESSQEADSASPSMAVDTHPPASLLGKQTNRKRAVEKLLPTKSDSQDSYNKIAELVPTLGTRSGRGFHSPSRPNKTMRHDQNLSSAAVQGQVLLAQNPTERMNEQDGATVDPPKEPVQQLVDELDFVGEPSRDAVEQHVKDNQEASKDTERRVSFDIDAAQESPPSPRHIPASTTGRRRRRKRKTPPAEQESFTLSTDATDQTSSRAFHVAPEDEEETKADETSAGPTSDKARRFAEMAQGIVGNQLPVIGRAMEEIWSSLLKVVPAESGDGAAPLPSGTGLQRNRMSGESQELLNSLRDLCDQQEASVRRLEDFRVSLMADSQNERHGARVDAAALHSSQLKLEREAAELKEENLRLREQLQDNVDLTEGLRQSRDQVRRQLDEQSKELKVKDSTIASQEAELKRLRDLVAAHESSKSEIIDENRLKGATPTDAVFSTAQPAVAGETRQEKPPQRTAREKESAGYKTGATISPAALLRKATKLSSYHSRTGTSAKHRLETSRALRSSRLPDSNRPDLHRKGGDQGFFRRPSSVKVPVNPNPPQFYVRRKSDVKAKSSKQDGSEPATHRGSPGPVTIDSP